MNLQLNKTNLKGVFFLKSSKFNDGRGSFMRAYDYSFLNKIYDDFNLSAINISESLKKGTLRGLHLQKPVKIKDLVKKRFKEKNSTLKIEFGKIKKRDYEPQSFWGHCEKLKEFF